MWKVLAVLVLLVAQAEAGNWVCGDTTKVHRYTQSVDATKVPACPVPFVVSEIPEADIPAQDALAASVPHRHLKVADGPPRLMVEMTQAEKDAVDAPAQAQAAAKEVAKSEMQTNQICANNTLPEITAYWKGPGGKQESLQATIVTLDTAIAAVTTGPAKTALVASRDALVAHMTMFIDTSELLWRYLCSQTFVISGPATP
jgi:hypothetical protein